MRRLRHSLCILRLFDCEKGMRMRGPTRLLGITVLTLAVLAANTRSAHADPVILSGLIFENVSSSSIAPADVSGTENFGWIGNIGPFAPSFGDVCEVSCVPGSTLSFAASTGTESFGVVTIGTDSFRVGGSSSDFGSLNLGFTGETQLPQLVGPTSAVSAPFSVAGTLFFPPVFQQPLRSVSVTGAGIATAFLAPSLSDPSLWRVSRLEYQFGGETAPVPEPSTMLLVGAGALALARRKFRRQPVR